MQIKSRQKSCSGAVASALMLATAMALVAPGAALMARATGEIGITLVLGAADLSAWQPWKFFSETRYTPVEIDGRRAVKAVSSGSASGYYRKMTIDLQQTPVLRWSWRVDNTIGEVDERSKEGDDYPARVYVIAAQPVFFWKSRALNYVWSSTRPEESSWPNAYSSRAVMIAVRSGERGLGKWQEEERNVRSDFERYFGKEVRYVDAIAFMTDTDNTGRQAVAYYGDIYFAER
ncbi:MAG: DUF3047 domain-containing protein [Gammaproteobacteria bacterium]|nr:DUF3047 domain-containing protein [Gammaproteobacteria bacterium]